jgi:hypothetical protein
VRGPWRRNHPEDEVDSVGYPTADEILTTRRLRDRLNRLTPEYRQLTLELLRAVVPKLKGVRRPADLKTVFRDGDLLALLEAQLYPVVERAIESANRGVLPLRRRYSSHFVVTLTGLAGPAAANATEVQGLIAMAFPPVGAADLAFSIPAAVLIGFASQLVEFYVEISVVATRLRGAGVSDSAIIRRVLLAAVAPGMRDVPELTMHRLVRGLAIRILARAAADWLPVVPLASGVYLSNRAMHRVHRAVDHALQGLESQPNLRPR